MNPTKIIPAAPGWVARRVWLDPDTDTVERLHFAVVGWAVGDLFADRLSLEELQDRESRNELIDGEPIVYDWVEDRLVSLGSIRREDRDETLDAVFFDPSLTPGAPPIDEARLRAKADAAVQS